MILKTQQERTGWGERLLPLCCALICYAALWGSLSGMAYLSEVGVLPLLAGAAGIVLTALLPKKAAYPLLAILVAAGAVLLLTQLDGVRLLLNRLMTASQQKQAYVYDLFPVEADNVAQAVRQALLPLGLLTGAILGLGARTGFPPVFAAVFCLYALGSAWLGVTPQWWWSALWAAALVPAMARGKLLPAAAALLCVGLTVGAVLLLYPGENAALSRWDESARDRLAAETVFFTHDRQLAQEHSTPENAPSEPQTLFAPEETSGKEGGDLTLPVPLPVLGVILLFAFLLFVPAILADRAKKRNAALLSALKGEDNAEAVKAAFLFAVRWLELDGFSPGNLPAAQAAEGLEGQAKEDFLRALPLWREAAYSAHPIDSAQRGAMTHYLEQTKARVWSSLNGRQKLAARYKWGLEA